MKITSNLNFLTEQEEQEVVNFLKEEMTSLIVYKSTATNVDILQHAENLFYAQSSVFDGEVTLPQLVQLAQNHQEGNSLKEKMLLVAHEYQFLLAYHNMTVPERPRTIAGCIADVDRWLSDRLSEEHYWKNQNQANIPLSLKGITHGMTFDFDHQQLDNNAFIQAAIKTAIISKTDIEQVLDAGLSSIIRDNKAILLVDPKPSLYLNLNR